MDLRNPNVQDYNVQAALRRDDSHLRFYMLLRVEALRAQIAPPKLHIQN